MGVVWTYPATHMNEKDNTDNPSRHSVEIIKLGSGVSSTVQA